MIYICSIGYKTAFMTSAKELLHSIKFRHGGYTGKLYEILGKTKNIGSEINDQCLVVFVSGTIRLIS